MCADVCSQTRRAQRLPAAASSGPSRASSASGSSLRQYPKSDAGSCGLPRREERQAVAAGAKRLADDANESETREARARGHCGAQYPDGRSSAPESSDCQPYALRSRRREAEMHLVGGLGPPERAKIDGERGKALCRSSFLAGGGVGGARSRGRRLLGGWSRRRDPLPVRAALEAADVRETALVAALGAHQIEVGCAPPVRRVAVALEDDRRAVG